MPRLTAQLFGYQEPGLQRIFVKAVTAITATEPGAIDALHRPQCTLCGECGTVELRMVIDRAVVDCRRGGRRGRVQGHEPLLLTREWLQAIHPITHTQRGTVVALGAGQKIPTGQARRRRGMHDTSVCR